MSKVLVVYGTKSGCTKGVAERIGETLSARGANVEVVTAESLEDPTGFDAIVVGSGVRAGTWHPAAREWVGANADVLKKLPVAFFTCGLVITQGHDKESEVRAYTDALIAETGIEPISIGVFAGWNEPKEFSFLERSVMKLMKAPQGDFRDPAEIAEWAEGIAPRLGTSATS